MSSRIKFLRRVRIHGGECGAVARALHHKVKSLSLPAVDGNVSFTTNERKSMSTKTSLLKRIAQTAVVGLFGGLMSVVAAPASNAAANTAISASCVAREAIGGVILATLDDAGDSTTVIRAVQTARTVPAGTTYTLQTDVASTGTETGTANFAIPLAAETVTATGSFVGGTITYLVWADLDGIAGAGGLTAPAVGDYTTTVACTIAGAPTSFTLSAASASVGSGETSTFTATPKDSAGVTTLLNGSTDSFTVTATTGTSDSTVVNLVSGKSLGNAVAKTSFADGANYGGVDGTAGVSAAQLANTTVAARQVSLASKFTGPSTASNRAQIGVNAMFADGAITLRGNTASNPHGVRGLATSETMTATGAFSFNVNTTGAGTTTVTVAGAGLLSGMTSASFTQTTTSQAYASGYGFGSSATTTAAGFGIKKVASGVYSASGVSPDKSGTYAAPANGVAGTVNTASATFHVSTARTSIPLTLQMSAAGSLPYTVAAVSTTSVTPAGITVGSFNATTTTETQTTITFTTTSPSAGQRFKVTWKDAATTTMTATFIYEAPQVATSVGTVALSESGKVAVGGTSTVTATVTDQYDSPANGASVIFSRTGRNATLANETVIANADGIATHTWTDASTSTTSLTDTVSVRAALGSAGTYTTAVTKAFTYVTALTATTLTLINNSAAAGVAVDGGVLFTATVLDASGLALSGYPVVFTGDAETYYNTTSNAVTKYTDTAGVATATFYGYTAGTATITAQSGGKSGTSSATILAGSSRAIAIDAATASMAVGESKRVTATVTDIYGNAVEAATVTITYVGTAGRVTSVNGVSSATGSTDAAGKVVVEVSGDSAGTGTLTLKITAGNTSTLALTSKGSARPAKVETVTTAVTITGQSAAVTAAEAATDAAAEAIDAANAATDAANLAAEAADAATVAAEEARDAADAATAAVEELATQVATLMAALKAQITTLANTVAKIAKKVKA